MRRKEKRLLQFAGLLIAALLFLPNVGLWSLYKDRVFDNSPDIGDGPGGIPSIQVGEARLLLLVVLSYNASQSGVRGPSGRIKNMQVQNIFHSVLLVFLSIQATPEVELLKVLFRTR